MKSLLALFSGLLLMLTLNGCATCEGERDSPQPCQAGPQPFSSLEKEYGCDYTRLIGLSGGPAPAIIRSQAEFDQRVSGRCNPKVDFARYDLIIGQQPELGGAASASVSYDYQRNCSDVGRVLRVVLTQGVTKDLGTYTYHVLVPKLPATETVKVEVLVLPNL